MANDRTSVLDRHQQAGIGEGLRKQYGDPMACRLPQEIESLLDSLRERSAHPGRTAQAATRPN